MSVCWAHLPCLWQAYSGLQLGGLVESPEAGCVLPPVRVLARGCSIWRDLLVSGDACAKRTCMKAVGCIGQVAVCHMAVDCGGSRMLGASFL
jgi:hypothetical protein